MRTRLYTWAPMVQPLHQISLDTRLYMTVVSTPLRIQYQTVVTSLEPGGAVVDPVAELSEELQNNNQHEIS